MARRALLAASCVLAAACGENANPFAALVPTRAPSGDAALVIVSGSWADAPGRPREVLALSADGARTERLTSCADAGEPCDFVKAIPTPQRTRIGAIRTTPDAEEGATTLYFMDLSRSVQTILFPRRRVESADWSPDDSFIIYSSVVPQTTQEDLFYSLPNGNEEQNLTQSLGVGERNARIDPTSSTAVYERTGEDGVTRVYIFRDTPVTSGPAAGGPLPGTPYVVGSDADPVYSPDGSRIAFRRLTGTGNGGLGTWDVLSVAANGVGDAVVVASGPRFRGAPDWGSRGILFVETDAAAARSELVLAAADGTSRQVLRTEDAGYRMGSPRWLYPR